MENSSSPRTKRSSTPTEELGHESDILSFWLLLLFIAVFFGIAAEEARRPMFPSNTSVTAQVSNPLTPFSRNEAAREYDLSSVEANGPRGLIGSRTEKFEAPATGK